MATETKRQCSKCGKEMLLSKYSDHNRDDCIRYLNHRLTQLEEYVQDIKLIKVLVKE